MTMLLRGLKNRNVYNNIYKNINGINNSGGSRYLINYCTKNEGVATQQIVTPVQHTQEKQNPQPGFGARITRNILSFTLGVVLVGGYGYYENYLKHNEIYSQISDNLDKLNSNVSKVSLEQEKVNNDLQEQVNVLNKTVNSLQAQLNKLQNKQQELETKVETPKFN
eukprot:TRINITY_DN63281_c0_g1_i1.p1 TRINITY_DN63281_c0_g1~~TRINITY_DN63281_c0_g1_i1.p1  ORF type:complete len:166 (+),score=21.85 TRINITY_DN63281_c0_g1_i1:12-509(+)